MRALRLALLGATLLAGALPGAVRAAEGIEIPSQSWSFSGLGGLDLASAQRGFQVYAQVCSNCHSLKQLHYRDLTGLGFSDGQVKAIAAGFTVPTGTNDQGDPTEGPATPASRFRSPYANDKAARAALNGALPPDMSVLEKAREGGPNYIYALMHGYGDPPEGMKIGDGLYYNKYFPGGQIAMPPPLQDDVVTYTDGTKATLDQEARDVATFLTWTANPEMVERKRMGVHVVLFLAVLTGLTYALKRKVWAKVH